MTPTRHTSAWSECEAKPEPEPAASKHASETAVVSTRLWTWMLLPGPGSHLQAAHFAVCARRAGAGMAGDQRGRGHPREVLVVQQEGRHLPNRPLAWPHAPAQALLQPPKPSLHPARNQSRNTHTCALGCTMSRLCAGSCPCVQALLQRPEYPWPPSSPSLCCVGCHRNAMVLNISRHACPCYCKTLDPPLGTSLPPLHASRSLQH